MKLLYLFQLSFYATTDLIKIISNLELSFGAVDFILTNVQDGVLFLKPASKKLSSAS